MSQSPLLSQGRGQGEGFCRTSNDAVNNPSPQSSPPHDGERQICPSARLSLSAVLLAGGESRRMGTDKATFVFRGKPLWQVQLETLQKLRPKEIFVSARIDPPWRREDVLFVADLPPSRGPLSGLAASMNQMTTTHLLALAIDMPWMTNEYLELLCAQMEPGRGVLPKIDDRAEPLAAIYPRQAAIETSKTLAGTDFSLRSLAFDLVAVGKLRAVPVRQQEEKFFRNINELSDLKSH
jgi:molybdenum cofactor guanylyltransferase